MELNRGQEICAKRFLRWWKNPRGKRTFEISGAAGTGKTFLVRQLIEKIGLDLKDVMFMAYVGKATLALSKNGLPAKTIHSSICDIRYESMIDEDGNKIRKEDGTIAVKPVFYRKRYLPDNVKLLVVDEGRMVPEMLAEWIVSYNIPVVVLGDLNQLDPVFGAPYFLNDPDAILTEIMRQAKESPIPHLAKSILKGAYIKPGTFGDGQITILADDFDANFLKPDIVICGKNRTRKILNDYIRRNLLGMNTNQPLVGDKLICRKNDWNKVNYEGVPLVNGMIGRIRDINYERLTKNVMRIDFAPEDFEDPFFDVEMDRKTFKIAEDDETYTKPYSLYDIFEYGYVITCHLAQGSQYDSVMVKYEYLGGGSRKQQQWLYTAVTRAIKNLTLILG